jgi:hypothetical protein
MAVATVCPKGASLADRCPCWDFGDDRNELAEKMHVGDFGQNRFDS